MGTTNDGYTHEEVEEQRERLTRADGTISIMEMIEDNKKNPPKPKKRKTKAKETISVSSFKITQADIDKVKNEIANKDKENTMHTITPTIEKTKNETKEKPIEQKRKDQWYEVTGELDKVEFKNIVHILNRYYDLNPSMSHPTPAHIFRQEIVASENKDLRIFLKQFGKYEFLIVVEISFQSKEKSICSISEDTQLFKENLFPEQKKKMDSWIHVDGVSQERIIMKEKGIHEHPVFNITSLQDILLKKLTVPVKSFVMPDAKSKTAAA